MPSRKTSLYGSSEGVQVYLHKKVCIQCFISNDLYPMIGAKFKLKWGDLINKLLNNNN